ncbi:hypothetical protein [Pseudomonas sp. NPDC088444]|uniref:hypothetical protein n=1 Tax=Pseudomonas sp. NPDC088444 TaxID=3364456 RepID=UPI003850237A
MSVTYIDQRQYDSIVTCMEFLKPSWSKLRELYKLMGVQKVGLAPPPDEEMNIARTRAEGWYSRIYLPRHQSYQVAMQDSIHFVDYLLGYLSRLSTAAKKRPFSSIAEIPRPPGPKPNFASLPFSNSLNQFLFHKNWIHAIHMDSSGDAGDYFPIREAVSKALPNMIYALNFHINSIGKNRLGAARNTVLSDYLKQAQHNYEGAVTALANYQLQSRRLEMATQSAHEIFQTLDKVRDLRKMQSQLSIARMYLKEAQHHREQIISVIANHR